VPAKEAFLRDKLPRIFELKDMQKDQFHPDGYFRDFEQSLKDEPGKHKAFLGLERQLAMLDTDAWEDLKQRAADLLLTRTDGRGWQALFDIFNEALGYGYLRSIGSTNIRFIPRAQDNNRRAQNLKTPDLEGQLNGDVVLCEVKTVNISRAEADRRHRIRNGEVLIIEGSTKVGDGFLQKLILDLEYAVKQLDAQDPQRKALRFIFTVLCFDDWVGDCYPEYFQQIDEHLLANPFIGAEIVFCPSSNLFRRKFTMRSARVFDPGSSMR
jgi:hypothetical protein